MWMMFVMCICDERMCGVYMWCMCLICGMWYVCGECVVCVTCVV